MRTLLILLLAVFLAVPAAAGPREATSAPSGPLAEEPALLFYGLYLHKEPKVDPIPELRRAQEERFPFLTFVNDPSEITPGMVGYNVTAPPIHEYPPPEAALLDLFSEGLGGKQRAWLPKARGGSEPGSVWQVAPRGAPNGRA